MIGGISVPFAREGRLQALAGDGAGVAVAAVEQVAELRLVEGRVEVAGQDPGGAAAGRGKRGERFFPAADAARLGRDRDGRRRPAPGARRAASTRPAACGRRSESRPRQLAQRQARVEAGAGGALAHLDQRVGQQPLPRPACRSLRAKLGVSSSTLSRSGWRRSTRATRASRVGGAVVDVGGEHAEGLVAGGADGAVADRPRQDRGGEAKGRDRGDRRGRPVAQRDARPRRPAAPRPRRRG